MKSLFQISLVSLIVSASAFAGTTQFTCEYDASLKVKNVDYIAVQVTGREDGTTFARFFVNLKPAGQIPAKIVEYIGIAAEQLDRDVEKVHARGVTLNDASFSIRGPAYNQAINGTFSWGPVEKHQALCTRLP